MSGNSHDRRKQRRKESRSEWRVIIPGSRPIKPDEIEIPLFTLAANLSPEEVRAAIKEGYERIRNKEPQLE